MITFSLYNLIIYLIKCDKSMTTILSKKILRINNRTTSIQLCTQEWLALGEICESENIHRNRLIELIDNYHNQNLGLTYSTRLFMLLYYKHRQSLSGECCTATQISNNIRKIIDEIR